MDMATFPFRGAGGEPPDDGLFQPCTDSVASRDSTHSWSGNDLAMLTSPRLTTHHHVDYSVVALRGEFDVASRDLLSRELQAATSSCTAGTLVIDLAGVEFLDCTVLGVLIHAHRQATRRGLRLVMVSPPGAVQRLLDITRIDRTVPTRPHLRAALSAPATAPHQDSSDRRLA